jgi:endonuclease G
VSTFTQEMPRQLAELTKSVDADSMAYIGLPGERGEVGGETLESIEPPPGTEWQEVQVGFEGTTRKTIRVLVSQPETFDGRTGYDREFFDGWDIPIPVPKNEGDMRPIRHGGQGYVLTYEHFSTIQSVSRRMPLLVAVNINGTKSKKITRVSTPWRFDGRLDIADQIGDEVYADEKNVLDRGHMVRREDPVWGSSSIAARANVDTFHFTNACPQMAKVNQQIWLGLENYILLNARKEALGVSVFTGPVFGDNDIEYRGALIPRSFFKVVAVVLDDGRPSATAYEVSQEEQLSELEFAFGAYKTFQTSVVAIEEKTQLDFGDLSSRDGFSVTERNGRSRKRVELESLEMIRV